MAGVFGQQLPEEQDLSKGILEAIDSGGGGKPEPELDLLSNILKAFSEMFGNIDWKDADKIGKVIAEELPAKVAANKAYQNAMQNSDKQNARIEHDKALELAVIDLLSDHTELFKQFSDNPSFKKWLSETIFAATYGQALESQPVQHADPSAQL
jgi:type I restriction enzyme, R subunit